MTVTPEFTTFIEIGGGICWTLVYLLIIKHGFQEKTYGMPLWALAANISWEFIFAFVLLTHSNVQHIVDIVWFLFDTVIVFQFLRYGRSHFEGTILAKYFYPMFLLVLVVSFGAVYTMTLQLETLPHLDGRYAAFSQNLVMSILFVSMLINRINLNGQSIYIVLFKMIGTLLPSILYYRLYPANVYLDFLYVAILVFDLLYVALIYVKARELKINSWTRL